ncbi:MAG: glycosyl transferase, partial [Muribaculaceae bacterium]|nr:glycosyl transferase [Muribaculaceae bacterium]
ADIVDHMQNGYIARGGDVADLVEGLHWAFETPLRRDVLHQNVERRFSASVVARRYIEVYQCVLSGRE